ncbi:hypothetical protein AAEX28_00675 [Lentisphaerota bacterium WC36G]|nr:hypothetical protein LJT99_03555 [Lentisphaerae bacterium WC36]
MALRETIEKILSWFLVRFFSERGQSMVEYAIMAFMLVLCSLTLYFVLDALLGYGFNTISLLSYDL